MDLKSKISELANLASDDSVVELPDMKIEVGDVVAFGRLNGKRFGEYDGHPIYWRVYDTEGEKAFLIAEQFVDYAPYKSDAGNVGVTTADPWGALNELRMWLHMDFRRNFLNTDERARLVRNSDNDYVSLLTIEEAEHYFRSDSERRLDFVYERDMERLRRLKEECEALDCDGNALDRIRATVKRRSLENEMARWHEWNGWWLRPSGLVIQNKHMPYVAGDGSIRRGRHDGMHAARSLGIRPAMWINAKEFRLHL